MLDSVKSHMIFFMLCISYPIDHLNFDSFSINVFSLPTATIHSHYPLPLPNQRQPTTTRATANQSQTCRKVLNHRINSTLREYPHAPPTTSDRSSQKYGERLAINGGTPNLSSLDTSFATRPAPKSTNNNNPAASRSGPPASHSRVDDSKSPPPDADVVAHFCESLTCDAMTHLIKGTHPLPYLSTTSQSLGILKFSLAEAVTGPSQTAPSSTRIEFHITNSRPTSIYKTLKAKLMDYTDPNRPQKLKVGNEADSALGALEHLFVASLIPYPVRAPPLSGEIGS